MPTTTRNITATKNYHSFQRKNLLYNIVAGKAVITSAVAGGITLNPIVFASLTGFGLVVKAVASFKKYDKKNRESQLCQGRVQEILDAIRFYPRGEPFNEKAFLDKLKMVDDFINDHSMELATSKIGSEIPQTFYRSMTSSHHSSSIRISFCYPLIPSIKPFFRATVGFCRLGEERRRKKIKDFLFSRPSFR